MNQIDYENQLKFYEDWIEKNHPKHDRNNCDDIILYNSGSVMTRHRCERCESLNQLRYWKLVHNVELIGGALARLA